MLLPSLCLLRVGRSWRAATLAVDKHGQRHGAGEVEPLSHCRKAFPPWAGRGSIIPIISNSASLGSDGCGRGCGVVGGGQGAGPCQGRPAGVVAVQLKPPYY